MREKQRPTPQSLMVAWTFEIKLNIVIFSEGQLDWLLCDTCNTNILSFVPQIRKEWKELWWNGGWGGWGVTLWWYQFIGSKFVGQNSYTACGMERS